MDAEGDRQSVRSDKLQNLIVQLERALAELDDLGFSRIAIALNEAIELARATRISFQIGPSGGQRPG